MGQSLIKCILEKKVSDLEIIGAVDLWDAENLNNDIFDNNKFAAQKLGANYMI